MDSCWLCLLFVFCFLQVTGAFRSISMCFYMLHVLGPLWTQLLKSVFIDNVPYCAFKLCAKKNEKQFSAFLFFPILSCLRFKASFWIFLMKNSILRKGKDLFVWKIFVSMSEISMHLFHCLFTFLNNCLFVLILTLAEFFPHHLQNLRKSS